ncbi:MAG: hypothetical protein ACTSVY_02085 [Candidatus Helarchaeota archaeon]
MEKNIELSNLCLSCNKYDKCEHKNEDILSCIDKIPMTEKEKLILDLLQNLIQNETNKDKLMELQLLRSFVLSIYDYF